MLLPVITSASDSSEGHPRDKRLALHPSQWSMHLWPGGVVPYEIASHYDPWERSVILSAMAEFPKHTCISFRPRNAGDRYYLSINKYYNLERSLQVLLLYRSSNDEPFPQRVLSQRRNGTSTTKANKSTDWSGTRKLTKLDTSKRRQDTYLSGQQQEPLAPLPPLLIDPSQRGQPRALSPPPRRKLPSGRRRAGQRKRWHTTPVQLSLLPGQQPDDSIHGPLRPPLGHPRGPVEPRSEPSLQPDPSSGPIQRLQLGH
ncbi:astacin, partial [Ostertagia ostertagi]